MVDVLMPDKRPDGFQSFRVEQLGRAGLRYGLNVRKNELQATLSGAPIGSWLNLIALPRQRNELLRVARLLANAPCTTKIDPHAE